MKYYFIVWGVFVSISLMYSAYNINDGYEKAGFILDEYSGEKVPVEKKGFWISTVVGTLVSFLGLITSPSVIFIETLKSIPLLIITYLIS